MEEITLEAFASRVKLMREAQNSYFRTRAKGALIRSKQLEKEVDDMVKLAAPDEKKMEQTKLL